MPSFTLAFDPTLLASTLAMATFAFTGAITPGPVNVLALRHGHSPSRMPALLFVLGASLSYAVVVWLTGLGMLAHLPSHPHSLPAARWLCAAYLLWLAWRLARSTTPWGNSAEHPTTAPALAAFREGVLTQVLNPKAWLFAMSAVGVFVLQGAGTQHHQALGLLSAISLLACGIGVGIWAMAGHMLLRRLKSGTPRRLNQGLAALLAISVLGVLF